MTTLIIHAPRKKAEQEGSRSFQRTIELGIGEAYAIPKADADRLVPGDKVVVLDNDQELRAEGTLKMLVQNGTTETGMKRYDVHIDALKSVAYKSEGLGRTGVSVV